MAALSVQPAPSPFVVARATLLDTVMPVYHASAVHSIVVQATPEEIDRAYREITLSEIAFMRPLFQLRSIPYSVRGRKPPAALPLDQTFFSLALGPDSSWILLAEEPPYESVIGAVGIFDTPSIVFANVHDLAEFQTFDDPRYERTALALRIIPGGDPVTGYTVVLASRTFVIDPARIRRFGYYWWLVKGGESVMAQGMLRAIKRRAERAAAQQIFAPVA